MFGLNEFERTQEIVQGLQESLTFTIQLRERHLNDPEITEICNETCRLLKQDIAFLWRFYKFSEREEARQNEHTRRMLFTTPEFTFTYGADH